MTRSAVVNILYVVILSSFWKWD